MDEDDVGKAMGVAATAWWAARESAPDPTKEEALAALDLICKPWAKRDVEFEAEDPEEAGQVHPEFGDWTDPINGAPLGRLIIIAFDATSEQIEQFANDEVEPWYEGPYEMFRQRYEFT